MVGSGVDRRTVFLARPPQNVPGGAAAVSVARFLISSGAVQNKNCVKRSFVGGEGSARDLRIVAFLDPFRAAVQHQALDISQVCG